MTDPVPTTCMRCAVGCGHVQQGVDGGYGLDTVRGDPAHPVNRGLACQRGISETAEPEGEWLTRPLVRENGDLVPRTWDVALPRVIDRFGGVADRTPDGIAVLGSGQQTNEAAYALGKLARGAVGTRYYDANTTLCMASAVTAYYDAFGSDAPPPTYDDIPDADSHVVWGANPAIAHPVMFRWIVDSAGEDGSELIVVDPVRTRTAEAADRHVAPEPGGDFALARAILSRVLETDRVDEGFVEAATTGFDELVGQLPEVGEAAAEAGVDVETVTALASAFDEPTLVYWGMGINQSVRGTAAAGALIDCCLATGNLGPGRGPFSLTGQANSMGTRVCSSKGTWPGHRPFEDPDHRRVVAEEWGVPVGDLPAEPGPGPVGIVDAIDGGPVEAVYAVATNPAAGLPDAADAVASLEDAFLVVQDAFRTETVELADVVLPAATWGESNGTVINMERTVSRVRPATDLPGGVWTDLDVISTLGEALHPGLFEDASDPESVFDEFRSLTAGTPADLSGISYDRLERDHAVRWPAPDESTSGGYRYVDVDGEVHGGVDGEADGDGDGADGWEFQTPSGRARFSTGSPEPLPEPPDDDYPLTLTTGREPDGYNTGVRTRSTDEPGALVARVHPDTVVDRRDDTSDEPVDADEDEGERVGDGAGAREGETEQWRLESRRGAVPVRVEPDEAVPPELVWVPIHHPATNRLTIPETDPRSDEPNFKQCAVRLVVSEAHDAV